MKNNSVKTIVAIGIGAALFFVLGRYVSVPSPVPNTNISLQYGVLAFIAIVFGPIAGLFTGLIGHALVDFSFGWGIWWSWVIASAVFGLLVGTQKRHFKVDEGVLTKKDVVRFNITQLLCHVICWGAVAPALDILIYQEPIEKLFAQGLVAGISNFVTTLVVGTILLVAYAKAKPQKGSLKEE